MARIINAPSWVWQCTFGAYLLAEILYHFHRRVLPYQGQMRWLVFPELSILAMIDLTGIMPDAFVVGLRYGQFFLLLLVGRSLEKPGPFRIIYWPAMMLSFAIPRAILGQTWLAIAAEAFFHVALAFALFLASIKCRKRDLILPRAEFSPVKLLPRPDPKTIMDFDQCQKMVFKQMHRCFHVARQLCRLPIADTLSQDPEQCEKVQEAMETQAQIIASLESALARNLPPLELCKRLEESVLLAPFLEKQMQNSFFFRCAEGKDILPRPPKLQLHLIDEVPQRIEIPAGPFWRWVIHCWLHYFMAKKDESVKILISRDQHRNYLLKGIGKANIEKICHRLEGVRCPLCIKQVRSLYHFQAISETACRECMRGKVESKLRQDWECRSASSDLKLATRLVSLFQLGYIQYGIHHWDRWEYFITLGIYRM